MESWLWVDGSKVEGQRKEVRQSRLGVAQTARAGAERHPKLESWQLLTVRPKESVDGRLEDADGRKERGKK